MRAVAQVFVMVYHWRSFGLSDLPADIPPDNQREANWPVEDAATRELLRSAGWANSNNFDTVPSTLASIRASFAPQSFGRVASDEFAWTLVPSASSADANWAGVQLAQLPQIYRPWESGQAGIGYGGGSTGSRPGLVGGPRGRGGNGSIREDGRGAGGGTDAASGSSTNFIVSPSGTIFPVPRGATGPEKANTGKGMQYNGGSGGHGFNPKTTGVRIMDPLTTGPYPYPSGYGAYMNRTEQTVNPFTGQTIPRKDPWAHIPR